MASAEPKLRVEKVKSNCRKIQVRKKGGKASDRSRTGHEVCKV